MDILHTERLRLRWFTLEDAPFVCELLQQEDWLRYIGDPGVRTAEQAQDWLSQRILPRYWSQGHGFWAMERRTDQALIGLCGVIHREGLPEPDLGYGLHRAHQGQGYAREAARACRDYAAEVLGLPALLATTDPANHASGRLLRDLGFEDQGVQQTAAHPAPSQVYRWRNPCPPAQPPGDEAQAVERVIHAFMACFDNRGGRVPNLARLVRWCHPDAQFHATTAHGVVTQDLAGFLLPREALLRVGGPLEAFHETFTLTRLAIPQPVAGATAIVEGRYDKSGRLHGEAFHGGGQKRFELSKTDGDWRIHRLDWADDLH